MKSQGQGDTRNTCNPIINPADTSSHLEGGPRVVISTAAFHARVRGSFPSLGGLKRQMFLPRSLVKIQYCEEPP